MSRQQVAGSGVYGGTEMQVEPTHRAARVSLRPQDKGVFGAYSQVFTTSAFAAGAQAAIVLLAFRWATGAANCLVRRVKGAIGFGVASAQGDINFDLIRGTGVAAQYTGGATISLTGKSGARSTRMSASQQQIANTATGVIAIAAAAALSAPAPVWVLDSNPMGRLEASVLTGVGHGIIYEQNQWDEPLELQNGEGFLIRGTWPATGTPTCTFTVDWDEIDPARYFGMFG